PGAAEPAAPGPPAARGRLIADVIAATNLARRAVGCPDLVADPALTVAARAHSVDMAVSGYFRHDSPDGRSPFDRMAAAGFDYSVAAENIAAGQRSAGEVVRDWMDSPEHRANILTCSLTRIGVGLATGGSYGYYWTQDIATPETGP
ncbi:CAP domain-containing protein, partial [Frankia sp. AiPs1]|uniref:CAP domain-containing protein n=1 Tax=Frankia sp. AiPs1 TaxID=573493 RepID=UPI002042CCB6